MRVLRTRRDDAGQAEPRRDGVADLSGAPRAPGRARQFGRPRVHAGGGVGVAEVLEEQRGRQDRRGRVGFRCPAMSGAEPCTGSNIDGVVGPG